MFASVFQRCCFTFDCCVREHEPHQPNIILIINIAKLTKPPSLCVKAKKRWLYRSVRVRLTQSMCWCCVALISISFVHRDMCQFMCFFYHSLAPAACLLQTTMYRIPIITALSFSLCERSELVRLRMNWIV